MTHSVSPCRIMLLFLANVQVLHNAAQKSLSYIDAAGISLQVVAANKPTAVEL